MKITDVWYKPLNKNTYKLYAIRNYRNGKSTWNEFFCDMRMFNVIIKSIRTRTSESSIAPILNNIINLGNVFSGKSLSRLFFFHALEHPEVISDLKTFLVFVHRMPQSIPEISNDVEINQDILNKLSKL